MGPTVLITGFPPFPGAPVNPTQWLIDKLDPKDYADLCSLVSAVLPVDYGKIGGELEKLAASYNPDVIIHFGLAAESSGIRLERVARNEIAAGRVDNTGEAPRSSTICDGEAQYASGLPLETIASELKHAGLPVQWSDDAGGYLCNYVFYLGRAGLCPSVKTPITGFIHVPLLGAVRTVETEGRVQITEKDLTTAAGIVIQESVKLWKTRQNV